MAKTCKARADGRVSDEFRDIGDIARELSAKLELMAASGIDECLVRKRGIDLFYASLKGCTGCGLADVRSTVSTGIGTGESGLFIVIERAFGSATVTPGNENGYTGVEGGFLTDIITKGLNIKPEEVYLSFLLRCGGSEADSTEQSSEAAASCLPYLFEEIEALNPKVVLLFGDSVATAFLGAALGMAPDTIERDRLYDYKGVKVVSTYTLSELLKDKAKKGEFWMGAFRQGKII